MAKEDNFYMQILDSKRELSVGKSTNHCMLEGTIVWLCFMLEMWHVCL
jgi:hypothetical protein